MLSIKEKYIKEKIPAMKKKIWLQERFSRS